MALRHRWWFPLAVGLGLSSVIGCGPTIENEANPIGPPPDPSTIRNETAIERAERVKNETKELRQAKQKVRPGRFGPR
jgi:hypothetical protein